MFISKKSMLRLVLFSSLLLSVFSLNACKLVAVSLPDDFSKQAKKVEVKRPAFTLFTADKLKFGDYQALGLRRGWTRSTNASFMFAYYNKVSQQYQFHINHKGNLLWIIRCGLMSKEKTFSKVDRLFCAWKKPKSTESWSMMLQGDNDQPMWGDLSMNRKVQYKVLGTNRMAGSTWSNQQTTGYHVRIGAQSGPMIGAVQTVNSSIVWYQPGLSNSEKHVLASAYAAILFYRKPTTR